MTNDKPLIQTQADENTQYRISNGEEVELEGVDQDGNEVLVYIEPPDE